MYLADLHLHSRYSLATSRNCDLFHLELWGRKKGLSLLGTGDFTHPAWRSHLQECLLPAEEGLYVLKEPLRQERFWGGESPRFVISGEISCVFKQDGKTRRVHNLILLPSLQAAQALSERLETIGNLHSDGRPILGLSCRDLLEITLDVCPQAILIPAHIWTPHYSMLGAFSAFSSVEECFLELAPYIHALETGLSSDPSMNRRLSSLDRYTLISNSDAHSPQKLGREANLFDTGFSYPQLKFALETGSGFAGTVEFFPEEGKYHLDGHRNCQVCFTPAQTEAHHGICPVCGKKLTIGVEHRIKALSDRETGLFSPKQRPFETLLPLTQVLSACFGGAETSKKIQAQQEALLQKLGPEFYILREAPLEDIRAASNSLLAEGIRRLRVGEVTCTAGFDGKFGSVSLFSPEELKTL